jgi:hypothetical protein
VPLCGVQPPWWRVWWRGLTIGFAQAAGPTWGLVARPEWLDSDGLHAYLLGRLVADGRGQAKAVRLYAELVNQSQAGDAGFWQAALALAAGLSVQHVSRLIALGERGVGKRETP